MAERVNEVIVRPYSGETPPPADGGWGAFPEKPAAASWDDFPDTQTKSSMETGIGLAKAGGIGIAKGAIGLPGMAGDMQQLAKKGEEFLRSKLPEAKPDPESVKYAEQFGGRGDLGPMFPMPTSEQIQHVIETITGPFRKPENKSEEAAQTVGEFLPAALAGPGSVARKVVTQDIIPATANIVAGRYSNENPYVKALASVLAGGSMAALAQPGSAEKILRAQLPEFVTEQHITRAGNLIQHAEQRGVGLTWPEALSRVTGQPVLTDTQRILESHPQTRTQMQTHMADRPAQIEGAVAHELDNIGPQSAAPSTIGPQASQTAESTINSVRGAINRATRPSYDAAAQTLVPVPIHAAMISDPLFAEALHEVRSNPAKNSFVGVHSDRSVAVYDAVAKELEQRARNAAQPTNPHASQAVSSATGTLGEQVKDIGVRADREAVRLAQNPPPVRSANLPHDVPSDLFRGYGRAERGSAYGGGAVPILGDAKYFSFDQKTASKFGPNLEAGKIENLRNPLVITDGNQWRQLTREAGWEFPNPFGQSEAKLRENTDRLQSLIKSKGHDGVVVWWDDATKYDVGRNGENLKTLRDVFDKPQAIVFDRPAPRQNPNSPPVVGNYEHALSEQARLRQTYLEPLQRGPLGKLADAPDTKRAIEIMFDANPLPGSHHEIGQAIAAIAQRRPAVAEQLVRAHAEMVFNEAARDLQAGANHFSGAKFVVRLTGNAQQRENLRAAVEALPNGAARWEGLDSLLDVLAATGTRQPKGSLTAFNRLDNEQMTGAGLAALAAKGASPGKYMTLAHDAYKAWSMGRNLDTLARIITDPRSGDALRQISRIPPGSERLQAVAGRLIMTLGASTTDQRQKPN